MMPMINWTSQKYIAYRHDTVMIIIIIQTCKNANEALYMVQKPRHVAIEHVIVVVA